MRLVIQERTNVNFWLTSSFDGGLSLGLLSTVLRACDVTFRSLQKGSLIILCVCVRVNLVNDLRLVPEAAVVF